MGWNLVKELDLLQLCRVLHNRLPYLEPKRLPPVSVRESLWPCIGVDTKSANHSLNATLGIYYNYALPYEGPDVVHLEWIAIH